MKLAVVPITDGAMDIVVENDHDDHDAFKPYECKLTKEWVEVMKRAYLIESFTGDKCPMIAALKAIGIEVE